LSEGAILIDLVKLLRGEFEEAKEVFGRDTFNIAIYGLPRSRLRIKTYSKRIEELSEGKISRLEYSIIYTYLDSLKEGKTPRFREFADLAGDYKAASAYISFLVSSGYVSIEDKYLKDLYSATYFLRRKTYEHAISRLLDMEFSIDVEKLGKSNREEIVCAKGDDTIICKYAVRFIPKSQAKAITRATLDFLKSL